MNYNYIPINRIFSKFSREISDTFNEGDLIEMTGEALEFIGAIKYYEEAVAFIEVKDHQAVLPKWLHSIIQIAKDNRWVCATDSCTIKVEDAALNMAQAQCKGTIQWTDGTQAAPRCATTLKWDDDRSEYIMLDCEGQPIENYNLAYYRPYFDLRMEYDLWLGSGLYNNRFTPVRLATSTLYNTLVCNSRTNNNSYGDDTYTVIRNTTIRCSFRTGMLAVAYTRQVVEEGTGYPLIPDHISYTTAIVKYIVLKQMEKDFYAGREGAKGRMDDAQSKWDRYCLQAGNAEMMPYGVDEYQNLLDQRQYILPKTNNYYSFFGNLAKPEQRNWLDPDHRNHRGVFIN